jgi:hypothetical protein
VRRYAPFLLGIVLVAGIILLWRAYENNVASQNVQHTAVNEPSAAVLTPSSKGLNGADKQALGDNTNPTGASVEKISALTRSAIQSVDAFRNIEKLARKALPDLTDDEMSVLRYVTKQCEFIATQREGALGDLANDRAKYGKRADAAKRLVDACDFATPIPLGVFRTDVLGQELLRRGHTIARLEMLEFSKNLPDPKLRLASDFGVEIGKVLTQGDVMAMGDAFNFVENELGREKLGEEYAKQGIPPTDLQHAWTLARCELVGGCGSDSFDALWTCALRAVCDQPTARDAFRAAYPDSAAAIDSLIPRMLSSTTSGDWRWLGLSRLK